jgi:hypothetical protein
LRKRRMEGREEKPEIAEAFIDEIEENERERDLDIEDGAISDANN